MMLNEDQLLIFYGMCGISQRYLVQGYKQNILDDKKSSKFVSVYVCVHAKV